MHKNLIFFILFVLSFSLAAQEADSLHEESLSPFRKGRWFTGLSGTIYTRSIDNSVGRSPSSEKDIFGYSLDVSTGKFIANRMLLGLVFVIEKENSNDILYRDIETLLIGPYYRYYFSDAPLGSLYAGVACGFNNYIDSHNIDLQNQLYDERLKGKGISFVGELGYGLNIKDFISFDLSVNYIAHNVSGTFVNFQSESSNVNFWRRNFYFKFGFNVILDEFFF